MILLATHSGADFDALASLMLASKLYTGSKIFLSPGPGKKVRKFLEKEGFPGEIAKEDELENLKADILVLLDISSIRRTGGAGQFLNPKTEIHIYDHHPPRQSDSDAAVEVRRKTGATATILVGLLREKGIILSPEEATLAALGVSEDTGGLTFPNTTNEDKEVFRYLLKIGANLSLIANYTEETLDAKHKKLLEDLLENKKELDTAYGKITILTADISEYIEDLSLAVQRAVELISPEVLIAFINTGEKLICIARSATEKFKAGKIFSEFGGGGHATAASVTVNSSDFHLKKRIIHHLKTSRPPDEKIIINPARILPSSNTAMEVYRSMLHLNQRRAPVGDASGKLRGIVERKELRKALRHNLANQPVTEFLSGRAPSAPDNLPSEILEKKLAAGGY
ncbi:MAG: hypothetical protein GX817_07090 [Elusimicrobia bacterium]|nr:hypothetical protein [Elusimicrobiota bacterium]